MTTRAPLRAYVAAVLIIVGIVVPAAYHHWLATRIFEPLRMPVSLRQGHIRSRDFYINFRNRYRFVVNLDPSFTHTHPECPLYVKTRFSVFRGGQLIEGIDESDYYFIRCI
jgi:hypothetical protein